MFFACIFLWYFTLYFNGILLCVFAVNGIAFANIYEVPKNENPQPAMGKLVGEIMIDFAFSEISDCELQRIFLESIEYSA